MNSFSRTFLLTILGLMAITETALAQLYEVPLGEKTRESTLIIEGRVTVQKSYRAENGEVYTANKILVSSILKGKHDGDELTVTTWGGGTETEIVTWTHMLTLHAGEEGVFFLEPSRVPESKDGDFPSGTFDVYAGQQGFLRYSRDDRGVLTASEPFNAYGDVEKELFRHIEGLTGQAAEQRGKETGRKSGIRYFFKQASFSGNTIGFEIYVNSLYGDKKLYGAGAVMKYNPGFFGGSVASNGNLQVFSGGISASTVYSFSAQDLSTAEVKIELKPDLASVNNLSTIGVNEQYLGKGELTIVDFTQDPGVFFDIAAMGQFNKFYDDGAASPFEVTIVETDIKLDGFLAPHIDSIYPDTSIRAGVGDTLTIYGSDFSSTQPSNGRVQFKSAFAGDIGTWIEPLPHDYIEWSDTKIRVIVPSVAYFNGDNVASFENYAGTGDLRVKRGIQNSNKVNLNVRFCARNDAQVSSVTNKDYRIVEKLRSLNGAGGYDIYFTPEFAGLAGAKDAFKRALDTWRCATKVNITAKDDTNIPADGSLVLFGALPAGCPSSSKACTRLEITSGCTAVGTDSFTVLFYNRFDIYFKSGGGINWHTGTNTPVLNWSNELDLETVALHELGHAHLLQHTNNTGDVMYFESTSYKREIEGNDLEGGLYIMGISSANDGCSTHMMPNTDDCGTPVIEVDGHYSINVYPNPFNSEIRISYEGNEGANGRHIFQLYDETGKRILTKEGRPGSEILLDAHTLGTGMYFLTVSDETGTIGATKLFKHN